jgi:hypothetical protein
VLDEERFTLSLVRETGTKIGQQNFFVLKFNPKASVDF